MKVQLGSALIATIPPLLPDMDSVCLIAWGVERKYDCVLAFLKAVAHLYLFNITLL